VADLVSGLVERLADLIARLIEGLANPVSRLVKCLARFVQGLPRFAHVHTGNPTSWAAVTSAAVNIAVLRVNGRPVVLRAVPRHDPADQHHQRDHEEKTFHWSPIR
jgi:hypothetical protein